MLYCYTTKPPGQHENSPTIVKFENKIKIIIREREPNPNKSIHMGKSEHVRQSKLDKK